MLNEFSTFTAADQPTDMADELTRPPTDDIKLRVCHEFFNPALRRESLPEYDDYFRYYETELALLRVGASRLTWQDSSLATQTHEDILIIKRELATNIHLTRPEIRHRLASKFQGAEKLNVNRSIDLTLRLWLTINVREPAYKLQTPQTPVLQWDDSTTLSSFVASHFPKARWHLDVRASRLDPYFTAVNMVRICGLKIEWTDSLEDHLRLDRRQKVLRMYPHKCCLQGYLESSHDVEGKHGRIYPLAVVLETIYSLNLLFPHWDPGTNKFLAKHDQHFHKIGPFDGPRTLDLLEFDHWRDRLSEVYEEIFRSPPVSWSQLWQDRRNPQQFWTFWIALIILALTAISTVATVIQAWASVKALN